MNMTNETQPENTLPEVGFIKASVQDGEIRYPDEPSRFTVKDVEGFFVWAYEQGASDITIQTDEQIVLHIFGRLKRVTNRRITQAEVLDIAAALFQGEAIKGQLAGHSSVDMSYVARPTRTKRVSFRVSIVPMDADGSRGVEITARSLDATPPTTDQIALEEEIWENMSPPQGLVLVAGATGSGKSTLLAACIRRMLEEENGNRKFITWEHPIEYRYTNVKKPSSVIGQHEIHRHIESWAHGIRNSLRRAPTHILMGEARDAEIIRETLVASMTGHTVYTTVHASNVSETLGRMLNTFTPTERNARAVDLISSTKMIVSQRLVKTVDGKRTALREYLVFTPEIVSHLLRINLDLITPECRKLLEKHGRTFYQDAQEKFAKGLIGKEALDAYAHEDAAGRRDIEEALKAPKMLDGGSH